MNCKTTILTLITLILGGMSTVQASQTEEKDYVGYLFTYFTGNHISEEAVRFAVSMDGYSFYALNGNKPVLDSKVISSTGGVRDPHILRCENRAVASLVRKDNEKRFVPIGTNRSIWHDKPIKKPKKHTP